MFVSDQSTNTVAKVGAAGSCISRSSEMHFSRPNQGRKAMTRLLLSLSLLRILIWGLSANTSWYTGCSMLSNSIGVSAFRVMEQSSSALGSLHSNITRAMSCHIEYATSGRPYGGTLMLSVFAGRISTLAHHVGRTRIREVSVEH